MLNQANLLEMLKIDLGISSPAYDERLMQYLTAAAEAIKAEGAANFDPGCLSDAQLTVMYAAWTWRSRDTMTGMPRMLRYALNNRVLFGG